jgi:endoglucanase
VIYVFHFYEPHIFTHQGATWGAYYWHWLKGLHYPSSPENAAQVATAVPEAAERLQVIRYGQDHWDASRVEAEINQAADWAKQRNVPLICNEFCVPRSSATALAGPCGTIPETSAWSRKKTGKLPRMK